MDEPVARLMIQLDPLADTDPVEFAELSDWLRHDLLQTDAHSVERPSGGSPPSGAKAGELIALGRLIVSVGCSVTNLRHVVAVIKSWVDRQPVRNVKITLGDDTLELTGASADDQRRLVDAWISRHAVPG